MLISYVQIFLATGPQALDVRKADLVIVCALGRVGDSEDPLERMLAVLRFAFTIQLKFVVRTERTTRCSPPCRTCV